jgi:hypothetical protein
MSQTRTPRAQAAFHEGYEAGLSGKAFEPLKRKYEKSSKEVKEAILKGFVKGQCERAVS